MDKKKQELFEKFYIKFLKECLDKNLLPMPILRYEPNAVIPVISFREITEAEKKEVISSLEEKK
jgi:hypothetical protein